MMKKSWRHSLCAATATFTNTITSSGSQIDHKDGKAGVFCAGADIKDKLKNVGKH